MKRLLLILALFGTCAIAQVGPCSVLTTIQIPATLPNFGALTGANTVVQNPEPANGTPCFHNPIARVTDGNTNPAKSKFGFLTAASGSGDENLFNTDSTLFAIQDSGTTLYPYSFNPATMQSSRMYVSSFPTTSGMTLGAGGTAWSYSNSQLLYILTSGAQYTAYDFTNRVTPPSSTVAADFNYNAVFSGTGPGPNCLPNGYTATWSDNGGTSKFGTLIFGAAFSSAGGQGTGYKAGAIKQGSGCSMLDLQTGTVTGDWGTTGSVTDFSGTAIGDRFAIHNVKLSKNGLYLLIAVANGSCLTTCNNNGCPYVWQTGTVKIQPVCGLADGNSGGHWSSGNTLWVNNSNTPAGQYSKRSLLVNTSDTQLIASFPSGLTYTFDSHVNWSNVNSTDTNPLFISTTETGSFYPTFPSGWYNEIQSINPVTGAVLRYAHTYSTGLSSIFDAAQAIGAVSQDGNFFIWTSDMYGTLGTTGGASTCQGGGPDWLTSHAYTATTVAACTASSVAGASASCIVPQTGNAGGYIFAVTTGGTSSGAHPTWPQTPTVTVTGAGGEVYTNANKPNCRNDAFIVNLSSPPVQAPAIQMFARTK